MSKPRTIHCRECAAPVVAKRDTKLFCSGPCRQKFNNRRRDRGAELYDIFMAHRYERARAKDLDTWTMMCRMAQAFKLDDERQNEGRQSWQDIAVVLADRPDLKAVVTNISIGRRAAK